MSRVLSLPRKGTKAGYCTYEANTRERYKRSDFEKKYRTIISNASWVMKSSGFAKKKKPSQVVTPPTENNGCCRLLFWPISAGFTFQRFQSHPNSIVFQVFEAPSTRTRIHERDHSPPGIKVFYAIEIIHKARLQERYCTITTVHGARLHGHH